MTDRQRDEAQLSESADSRTEPDERPTEQPQQEDAQPEAPGKHGRPTDDSDPGHS